LRGRVETSAAGTAGVSTGAATTGASALGCAAETAFLTRGVLGAASTLGTAGVVEAGVADLAVLTIWLL